MYIIHDAVLKKLKVHAHVVVKSADGHTRAIIAGNKLASRSPPIPRSITWP